MLMKRMLAAVALSWIACACAGEGGPAVASPADSLACSEADEKHAVPLSPPAGQAEQNARYLELGKFVTVSVPGDKYERFFTKRPDTLQPVPVLYLNGLALKGLAGTPRGCRKYSFLLQRTDDSRDVWGHELLRLENGDPIPVGIGTVQNGFVADVDVATLRLPSLQGAIVKSLAVMAVVLGLIFLLGARTGLLRDLPKRPPAAPDAPPPDPLPSHARPYSLARVQAAFWFALATGAYIYIWARTGDTANVIPASILTLMGISSATTVLSAVVDTTASAQNLPRPSGGFFRDILSEQDGVSFHRFQMLVWTVILGGVFIQKVAATVIMPDFDAQLLGLMGVSSLTYLGFKIPAAAAAPMPPATPAPAQPAVVPAAAAADGAGIRAPAVG